MLSGRCPPHRRSTLMEVALRGASCFLPGEPCPGPAGVLLTPPALGGGDAARLTFAVLLCACPCMSATLHCAHVVAVFALSFTLSPCLSPLCVMDAPQHSVGAFRQFSDWELSELYDEFNQLTNRDLTRLVRACNEVMQDRLVPPTPPESDNDGWESAQDDARPANDPSASASAAAAPSVPAPQKSDMPDWSQIDPANPPSAVWKDARAGKRRGPWTTTEGWHCYVCVRDTPGPMERPEHWPYADLFILSEDEVPEWVPLQDPPQPLEHLKLRGYCTPRLQNKCLRLCLRPVMFGERCGHKDHACIYCLKSKPASSNSR